MQVQTATWRPSTGWSAPLPDWDGPDTLVVAFGTAQLAERPAPLDELRTAFPTARVVGCSTAGEISGDTVLDDSLVVAVARFAHTRLSLISEPVEDPARSYDAGLSLAKQLTERDGDLAAVFVLSDGLGVNGSQLAAGLTAGTGSNVVVTGGLAGDGERFERTWVLADGQPRSGYVSAVGFGGRHLQVGHGSRGGWIPFGPKRQVTRSEGHVLYELDGQPALQLYKKYLGERAAELPASALLFPLVVWSRGAVERQVVRTILAVDEATQSLTFAGDVPPGSVAQLMRASLDGLVDAAGEAADMAADTSGGGRLAVAISCVGRRLILGGRTEDEIEAALTGLADGTELVGFYSYGEISPIVIGSCDLHNQTMTMAVFGERDIDA